MDSLPELASFFTLVQQTHDDFRPHKGPLSIHNFPWNRGIVIATPVITLKTRAMAKFSGNGNPKGACDVGGLAKGFRREHISTGLANMEQKEVI